MGLSVVHELNFALGPTGWVHELVLVLHEAYLDIHSSSRILFKKFISCLTGLRKSQRQISGMQTLLRETNISKSLDKFPVVYDRNPREVGHNSTCVFFLLMFLIM